MKTGHRAPPKEKERDLIQEIFDRKTLDKTKSKTFASLSSPGFDSAKKRAISASMGKGGMKSKNCNHRS
jgi:hypothetical protein